MPAVKRLTTVFRTAFRTVILTVFILLTAAGCSSQQDVSQQEASQPLGAPVYSSSIKDSNPDYMLSYEHYDADSFYNRCDEVLALAQAGKNRKAFTLFDDLWEEIDYISSLDTIASVLYMENASDTQLQEEADYMDALNTEAYDRLSLTGHQLATGGSAEAFKSHTGEESFQYYLDYEPMSEEEKELTLRETQLINQYYEVTDGMYELPYTYESKTYTLGQIYEEEVMDAMDYDTWYAVYEGCLGKFCQLAGPIFTELVQVRTQLAGLYGYDNYALYADDAIYGRDYTMDDLKPLKQSAKELQMSYLDYSGIPDELTENDGSLTELLAQLQAVADQCSPYASEACSFLCENRLYSLGAEASRFDQGYTTTVYQPQTVPFIYYKLYASTYDLSALVHELGHFTDTYRDEGFTFLTESLDLAEVQSAGLQMLAAEKYACCLEDKEASLLAASQLYEMVDSIVTGCLYDDWQRIVYEDPDMSLDDMCEAFRKTQIAYGLEDYPGAQYEWLLIPHNFNLPMYYVSYATSAAEALQIWQLAREDYDRAAEIWEELIDVSDEEETLQGELPRTFIQIMTDAGLRPFNDQGTVDVLLKDASDALIKTR